MGAAAVAAEQQHAGAALLLAMVVRYHNGGREDAEADHHEAIWVGRTGNIVVTVMTTTIVTGRER